MSIRSGLLLLGAFKQLQRHPPVNKALICLNFKQQIRNSGELSYRGQGATPKNANVANWLMGTFWWWIFWHLFSNYDELIGNTYPNPSDWTDEELGIPPINNP